MKTWAELVWKQGQERRHLYDTCRSFRIAKKELTLLLRSKPMYPADRARMGDFAVRQNHADRSEPLLNKVMDNRLEPVHSTWRNLWASQQRAEKALEASKKARDEADKGLESVFQLLKQILEERFGPESTMLARYCPASLLCGLLRPGRIRLTELDPLVPNILEAGEELIPASIREEFRILYEKTHEARLAFEASRTAVMEARDERAESDESWDEAYKVYQHSVEFVSRSCPDLIRRWILPWPPGTTFRATD